MFRRVSVRPLRGVRLLGGAGPSVSAEALVNEVVGSTKSLAAEVVPWYLNSMPASYFKQVNEAGRTQHVKAITAMRDLGASDTTLVLESHHADGSFERTFINNSSKQGLLYGQLKDLVVPEKFDLSSIKVFSSSDHKLALNIFMFKPVNRIKGVTSPSDFSHVTEYIKEIKAGKYLNDAGVPKYSEIFSDANMEDYLKRVGPSYIRSSSPRRFLIQRELFEKVRNTDSTVVHVEPVRVEQNSDAGRPNAMWLSVAAANVLPEVMTRLVAELCSSRHLDIDRCHLNTVQDPENSTDTVPGSVTMLRMIVSSTDGTDISPGSTFMKNLARDVKRAKWLDPQVTQLGIRRPQLGLDKAEVIVTLCSMLHGPLSKIDGTAFPSIRSVVQTIDSTDIFIAIAQSIAELFLDRFNPALEKMSGTTFNQREAEIRKKINELQLTTAKIALNKMLDAVGATLRTNYYNEDRYALGLRVDPSIMVPADKVQPFGVFFFHGRHFNGFHNRFRDIARGGLRIVAPGDADKYALESTRHYDEVYGLSYAQQLKNKDIPEGGSKGVILLNTPAIPVSAQPFAMRKAVRAYTDAMLDLMVKDSVKNLVDFYKKDEIIYLGPDERIIPADIEWITKRAGQRGYPLPAAFMSSKKDDGFNHMKYGVTSEGIVVFMDIAMRKVLNVDPRKQPFTIKITGGPDGDVAGNLMKILFREYGKNPKVVGVADGFGVAEDPEGLDSGELLRLVEEGKSIVHFDKRKLSKNGYANNVENEEGNARRNSMHNRLVSDVFIPAGGRPNTINETNWEQFLLADGKTPSSKLIVEGANIFTTPGARTLLFERCKLPIVKDSSANKCGVVTSSCEVQASMLLSKKEFMDNKPALVNDVLDRLRLLARLEGELMFREFTNYKGALPQFSEQISNAIAKVTDAITDHLANVPPSDPLFQELFPLIRENLPKKLADLAGDRIAAQYPVQYQRNAIATALATKIVYKEGIQLIIAQPNEKMAERAIMYFREDKKIQALIANMEKEYNGPNKALAIDVVRKAGARALLDIF